MIWFFFPYYYYYYYYYYYLILVLEDTDEDENSDPSRIFGKSMIPQYSTRPSKNEFIGGTEVNLTETETMEIFSKPGSTVSIHSLYYDLTRAKNDDYEKACYKQRVECPKRFHERAAQTFHNYQLTRETQTETKYRNIGVGKGDEKSKKDGLVDNIVEDLTSAVMMTEGALLDVSDGMRSGDRVANKLVVPRTASYSDILLAKTKYQFFHSPSIMKTLSVMEKAIQQNIYSNKQIMYRGFDIAGDEDDNDTDQDICDKKDRLGLLFPFKCNLTSNMKITCMNWNPCNGDVLAVGYGSKSNYLKKEGYIMLWSIRNPHYPEKVYHFTSSVTAIDFSLKKTEMLAVGLDDGRVLLYDTALQGNFSAAILDSAFSPGRHMSAVTNLKWVHDDHQGSIERLISISVDGRVMQWSSKKGLLATPLMTLKRTDSNLYKKGKLPNIAPGLSMDILRDGISYLSGTDDGSLNHCSLSYHEIPLTTVKAHCGPITSIRISPFCRNVFLTCSTDSTVKMYKVADKLESIVGICTIRPLGLIGAINDISWSPKQSTLFALVAQDGRVELWDVSVSILDPIFSWSRTSEDNRRSDDKVGTSVEFSGCGDILAIGDDRGCVTVFRVFSNKTNNRNRCHLEQVVMRVT